MKQQGIRALGLAPGINSRTERKKKNIISEERKKAERNISMAFLS